MVEIHETLELKNMGYTNGTGWQITAVLSVAPTIYEEINPIEHTKDRAFKLLGRIKEIVNEAIEEEKKNGFDFDEIIGFKEKNSCISSSPRIKSTRFNNYKSDYSFESMRRFIELEKKK